MIQLTKEIAEQTPLPNGEPIQVVYGDTDSVMLVMTGVTRAECKQIALDIAKRVTEQLPKPSYLKFEKIYDPYLLVGRKCYAGIKYETGTEQPDGQEVKGLLMERRDSCFFIRDMQSNAIRMILAKKFEEALRYTTEQLYRLKHGDVPIHQLLFTGQRGRDYKMVPPAEYAARKMAEREPGSEPMVGDRVTYVFTDFGPKQRKRNETADDPLYVHKHGVQVNYDVALDRATSAMVKVFELIYEKDWVEAHFANALRRVARKTPDLRAPALKSSLLSHYKPAARGCVQCGAPATGGLCAQCAPDRDAVVERLNKRLAEVTHTNNCEWQNCRDCAGEESMNACMARMCPHRYVRDFLERDRVEAEKDVQLLVPPPPPVERPTKRARIEIAQEGSE